MKKGSGVGRRSNPPALPKQERRICSIKFEKGGRKKIADGLGRLFAGLLDIRGKRTSSGGDEVLERENWKKKNSLRSC
jgi:hypothetical protein